MYILHTVGRMHVDMSEWLKKVLSEHKFIIYYLQCFSLRTECLVLSSEYFCQYLYLTYPHNL